MNFHTRATMAGAILGLLMVGWGAGSAAGATTIGQSPPPLGSPTGCAGVEVQTAVASGNNYAAPSDGVITSWTSSLNGTVAFSTFRSAPGAGNYARIAEDLRTINGVRTTFAVRMPVLAGDRIGVRVPGAAANGCLYLTGDSADVIGIGTTGALGGPPETYSPALGYRFNLSAVIEADADRDGYGDETQDGCPGEAAVQGPCPDRTAPETTITTPPKKKFKTKTRNFVRIKIEFSASEADSTFSCKLDGHPSSPCSSPLKAKIGVGKHRFSVAATDRAGNTDVTPDQVRFQVKRRRFH